jgi:group I intron endonuclease
MKETSKIYYCYKATNKHNGKVYIGFAADPHTRWRDHKYIAEKGKGYIFHAAIRKHGWDAFEFEVICGGKDKRIMLEHVEPALIDQYQSLVSQNGYNISRGGERMHFVKGDEKARGLAISRAKKGRPNGLKGKQFTEEHRRHMSEGKKGIVFSDTHIQNLSLSHKGQVPWCKGKHLSEETRKKIGQSSIGVPRAAQRWMVTYPDGHIEEIFNMAVFCRQHGLNRGNMSTVAKGKVPHHKGYTCQKVL